MYRLLLPPIPPISSYPLLSICRCVVVGFPLKAAWLKSLQDLRKSEFLCAEARDSAGDALLIRQHAVSTAAVLVQAGRASVDPDPPTIRANGHLLIVTNDFCSTNVGERLKFVRT